MSTITIKGTEAAIATASDVGRAHLVRVLNNKAAVQLVTLKNAGGTVLGTFTLPGNGVQLVKKAPTDTLTGVATTLAVAVSRG